MQYVHIYNDARGLMMCPNMSIKMERILHGDNQNIGCLLYTSDAADD